MNEAYLLTGGNMGDRHHYLTAAREAIEQHCGKVAKASSIFETAAWGSVQQASYYNQCLFVHTTLGATELLRAVLAIEQDLGRVRTERYGPRTIDIDILLFNNDLIDLPGLHVPHPQLPHRRFALECLHDIAPALVHPLLQRSVADLLAACTDPLPVHKLI